jgi:hypothetical protein
LTKQKPKKMENLSLEQTAARAIAAKQVEGQTNEQIKAEFEYDGAKYHIWVLCSLYDGARWLDDIDIFAKEMGETYEDANYSPFLLQKEFLILK